jgi:hypothetical protein
MEKDKTHEKEEIAINIPNILHRRLKDYVAEKEM